MPKLTKQQLEVQKNHMALQHERAVKVDRLGALEAEFRASEAAFALKTAESKVLIDEIRGWASAYAAELPVVFSGERYTAVCSEAKNQRAVDKTEFRRVVGDDEFFAAATIALGEVDRIATRLAGIAACVTSERTGKRTVATHAKAA